MSFFLEIVYSIFSLKYFTKSKCLSLIYISPCRFFLHTCIFCGVISETWESYAGHSNVVAGYVIPMYYDSIIHFLDSASICELLWCGSSYL